MNTFDKIVQALPSEMALELAGQCDELFPMDAKDRYDTAFRYAHAWSEKARCSDDPSYWNHCLSCCSCLMAIGTASVFPSMSAHFLRVEEAAQDWKVNHSWQNVDTIIEGTQ